MTSLRDNQLTLVDWFAAKQNVRDIQIAVLTDARGNQTSQRPLDDVWFEKSTRQVWHMTAGAATPSFIRCVNIPRPQVGLVVLIGKPDGSVETEVLQDANYLRFTGVGNQDWLTTNPDDLNPGGRLMTWIYSKQIVPLSTYPGSGLSIGVVAGDYLRSGQRETFEGATNYPLIQNPNSGEHYYAGLYLDSGGELQTVYGTSVSTNLTPPEPAWPDDAFRLSVIKVNDTQTSVDFDSDIQDRRMGWSDTNSYRGNVWPKPGEVNVGSTWYATLALANAAASAGDLIRLGEDVIDVDANFTLVADVFLAGSGRDVSVIVLGTGVAFTVPGSAVMQNLTITSGATEDVEITSTTLINVGFDNVALTINGGQMHGGHIAGDVAFANTPYLNFPVIEGVVTGAFTGHYLDSSGDIVPAIGGGDVAADTHAATSKATPADADELPLVDSADSWALKKLTWANLKATVLTWLSTLLDATKVSRLAASDGSPDPAIVAGTNGNLVITDGLSLQFGSGQAVTGIATSINSATNSFLLTEGAVYAHTNAQTNVHGLPPNVAPLGNRTSPSQWIQHGATSTESSGTSMTVYQGAGPYTVTFPVAFNSAPRVFVAAQNRALAWAGCTNIGTTSFNVRHMTNSTWATVAIAWLALGA